MNSEKIHKYFPCTHWYNVSPFEYSVDRYGKNAITNPRFTSSEEDRVLASSAPELLDAARRARSVMSNWPNEAYDGQISTTLQMLSSAISKALGEE